MEFNRHRFVLIEADDYAYNYMEKHHDQVLHSDRLSLLLCINSFIVVHCRPSPCVSSCVMMMMMKLPILPCAEKLQLVLSTALCVPVRLPMCLSVAYMRLTWEILLPSRLSSTENVKISPTENVKKIKAVSRKIKELHI